MSSHLSSNDQSGAAGTAAGGGGFDWRAQISEHPLAFSAGALAAGILVGYGLGGAFSEEDTGAQGGLTARAAEQTSYVSGKQDWGLPEGASRPGLIEKFRNTQAFDRLQEELSSLGDRLLSELSRAGREIVLPALTGKIKELLGADVSGGSQGGTTEAAQSARGT